MRQQLGALDCTAADQTTRDAAKMLSTAAAIKENTMVRETEEGRASGCGRGPKWSGAMSNE